MTVEEVQSGGPQGVPLEGEDLTPKRDGGVLKLVKQQGQGSELPMTGDKVLVHYVGTLLDGTPFDSSRDRGDKFSFELGKGQVIKAWDLGVASMRIGELSQFICRPEYAYGSAGSPPKIPPNATLVFQVELFEFRGEDLTENEDGGIVRRIVTKGEGYAKPNEGASVEVAVEGSVEGRVFDQREELRFEVGDGEALGLPAGVEKAVLAMEQGEESLFTIKPRYGFGAGGHQAYGVPAGATLHYRITLRSFEKAKESWEMNPLEKLEQSALVKERGTRYFKEGKFRQAGVQYRRVVSWLEAEAALGPEDQQKALALRLASHLNLAMCFLKTQEAGQALEHCDKALLLDEASEKALFRRSEALVAMKEFEEARAGFTQLLQLYPANRAAKAQLLLCQKHLKAQRDQDKRLYANMFHKFAEQDAKEGETKEVENGAQE